ncbi:low specificity L-threonine aldolase [Mesorhizobium sp.]|uniref:threonine aldolase family protein n=1 Tax=Mesorhizobium sp. TaxID=1871066 RepID=UPI000FE6FDA9|nr:low specificity L-threonine aldolase [Mesorhizobium sp.]RWA78930.1 MAG: low specificity L-threonine aldolase [Mesorhizobium sp.]
MDFRSDNISGVSPQIMNEIISANRGASTSYSEDELTKDVEKRLEEIFGHELRFFPVLTGTAANALGLSVLTPPYGGVFCENHAHIYYDECAAPEFYTGGAKLVGLKGTAGRLDAKTVHDAVERAFQNGVHHAKPTTVSISQATEVGTVYRPDTIGEIAAVCRKFGLRLHMDGARFANALTFLDVAPAELTWKAGVDVLCLGATKNGALSAESVIVFDKALAGDLAYRIKRSGHLASKSRFISAQWSAYLQDELWLKNSQQANAAAARLSIGLSHQKQIKLMYPTEANEVFLQVEESVLRNLDSSGVKYSSWPGKEANVLRFVTSFNTSNSEIDECLAVFGETILSPVELEPSPD